MCLDGLKDLVHFRKLALQVAGQLNPGIAGKDLAQTETTLPKEVMDDSEVELLRLKRYLVVLARGIELEFLELAA